MFPLFPLKYHTHHMRGAEIVGSRMPMQELHSSFSKKEMSEKVEITQDR